ncbi:SH3 domain-containing YSC84-like protein 1 [Bulinus truncatus]|nr:SH3 domain-containing YSC84-like protein 1 [Bulinus truncatus]
MVNTPIPANLKSEAKKAAKILRDFSMPSAKTGPDKLIPAGVIAKAKGLAIITVFKAGFLVTARGGSGIVIAKLNNDSDSYDHAKGWSAPSAIALAGLGGGFEIGLEVTDFVIILNTKGAVDAFSKGGNLTLGGNFTIAAGPLGRNIEGDIAVRSPAAIYTYSKTKGIFAGISVEGSALIERKDANKKFYGREIRAHQILSGEVDAPEECKDLYDVLQEHKEFAVQAALKVARTQSIKFANRFEESSSRDQPNFKPPPAEDWHRHSKKSSPTSKRKISATASNSSSRSSSSTPSNPKNDPWSSPTGASVQTKIFDPWAGVDDIHLPQASLTQSYHIPTFNVQAELPFKGELSCDLSFKAGDIIQVTTSTKDQDDWWEGIDCSGKKGIFPANYVRKI